MDIEQDDTLRRRVHKLADTVQEHGERLHEHNIMHIHAKEQIEALREDGASRHELVAHATLIERALSASATQTGIQLAHVQRGQESLQRAVNWVVALVIGAVLLAGLNLILHGVDGNAQPQQSIESPTRVR